MGLISIGTQDLEQAGQCSHYLSLLGTFAFTDDSGKDLSPRGTRARALLAMLGTSPIGVRSRRWLQGHLWSNRGEKEASQSLRQCLSEIRRVLGDQSAILNANNATISLDLSRVRIDIRHLGAEAIDELTAFGELPEFLEDIDIADPEFEDWIRDQRSFWETRLNDLREEQEGSSPKTSQDLSISGFGRFEPSDQVQAHCAGTPIIAVMPISIEAAELQQTHLVEGLAQEIIEQLSRIRWLATIARSSSFALPVSQYATASEFGSRLGAHYVVQGTIRGTRGAAKLWVELVRSRDSIHVWSRSFDIGNSSAAAPVIRIAEEIAGCLGSQIGVAEERRAKNFSEHEVRTTELVWRGRWYLNRLRREDSYKAEDCFRQALVVDPANVEAHVQLAWCVLWRAWASRESIASIRSGRDLGREAILLDNSDARGYWIVGTAESWMQNLDRAQSYIDEAIRLCPSMALARAQSGSNHILAGHPERALEPLDTAIRLSPEDQHLFYFLGEKAMAHWMLNDFEHAARFAEQAVLRRPSYWYAHMVRYLSMLGAGRKDDAARARRDLFIARPHLSADDIKWLPFVDRTVNAFFVDRLGLEMAADDLRYQRS